MKIFVRAKPGQREALIEKIDAEHFVVSVRERAENNDANFAIMKALAEYFHCPLSAVRLTTGRTSHNKIFLIEV